MSAPRTDSLSAPSPDRGPHAATVGPVWAKVPAQPSVQPPVAVTVTAVVVTRGSSPYLAATLAALRKQSRTPDSVVVVDVDTAPATSGHQDLQLGGARYVAGAGARTFGDAVQAALAASGAPEHGWLWLLHDDSAPAPGALAALTRSVEHSNAVAVAGCKQRHWETGPDGAPLDPEVSDRGVLLEVGHTVSPLGRRMTGIDDTEIDQGQHDSREDVLAVGLAGALVRASVWREVGGTDPAYGQFGDSTDFSRRVRLAGHRVVVVPDAVVRHAQVALRAPGSPGARRRSQLYLRLTSVAPWALPFVMLAMLAWAPFAAGYRLAMKHPDRARDELIAPLWAVFRLGRLLRARRRIARTSTVPRSVLRPLLGTWREVAAERRDKRLARGEADRVDAAPSELEQAELQVLAARRRAALATVVVSATGLAAALFGPALGALASGGRLVGGALLPADGTTATTWSAATSGWVRDGLGTAAPADPLLFVLTGLSALVGGSLQHAVNLVLLLALPLAAVGAWAAAGAVTRSVWLRMLAAFAWTVAPAFLGALDGGLLGAVLAHALLPWTAVALVRAVGAQAGDRLSPPDDAAEHPAGAPEHASGGHASHARAASLGAAGAGGLLLACVVAGAPALLPAAVLVLIGAAIVAPRRRVHLALAVVPALVVGAPLWWTVLRDGDRGLLTAEPLAGSGVPAPGTASGLELLLGLPAAPTPWFEVPDGGPVLDAARAVVAAGPWAAGVLVLALAVLGLVGALLGIGRRQAGDAARQVAATSLVGWLVAAAGLAVAVLAQDDGRWSGPGLSLLLLGLGTAALAGAGVLARRGASLSGFRGSARRVAVGGLVVVALLLPATQAAVWLTGSGSVAAGGRAGLLHVTTDPVVPAVGQQMQAPPRQARVLEVGFSGDGAVQYTLLRADGSQLADASAAARAAANEATDPTAALDTAVAALASGATDGVPQQLADLGIGAVQVRSDGGAVGTAAEAQPAVGDLMATLDMVPGMSRVTEGQEVSVWRVAPAEEPPPGWARVEEAGITEQVLPSGGTAVHAEVGAGGADRAVVLAEAAGPGWHATLDGRRLEPVPVDESAGLQAFTLGPDAGHLVVRYEAPHRTAWLVLTTFTLVVFALLALPVGRRRLR
ncbi:GT2 family glycosyltransferase [Promicromonospora sp. AC04]|uniref:glycosyltransferase family 2 protein n=1 Tax=Promicromonospora sp. AC04 TaxID=2135723 RepID=UPI000D37119D|nr:glycosyltransferase [Promicromonospora sp. AC04]PUB20123.1 GT2 family glycosyltransferase [Promicromonospora sp. AC04]